MKLKEFEAKQLLEEAGIPFSQGVLIKHIDDIPYFTGEKVLKVQTIANGRSKAGGIVFVKDSEEAKTVAKKLLGKEFLGEIVTEILLDETIVIKQEFYVGIIFNTSTRSPCLIFSEEGGVEIEELKKKNPEKVVTRDFSYSTGIVAEKLSDIPLPIHPIIKNLYACFKKFDCRMIEINPLVITPDNDLIAVDAVAVLDDDAQHRWPIQFTERTADRRATAREIAARKIDEDDHRGVAGKTFLDLDGDIAILTSGGGASMTLLDALIKYGGKPANFTEYSGNPPREKVMKLAKIVLDKKNLTGLLVAGVVANFTNIYETLQGVLDVLIEVKPTFPIVIRRSGPHDTEARRALQEAKEKYNLDIHYFDEKIPLTEAARVVVELSEQYTQTKQTKQMKQKKQNGNTN